MSARVLPTINTNTNININTNTSNAIIVMIINTSSTSTLITINVSNTNILEVGGEALGGGRWVITNHLITLLGLPLPKCGRRLACVIRIKWAMLNTLGGCLRALRCIITMELEDRCLVSISIRLHRLVGAGGGA